MLFFDINIDPNLQLRLKLIGRPCEKRFEIFEPLNLQVFLEKMPVKDVVNLYELFPPKDAYKFFQLNLIQDKLKDISFSHDEYNDILIYFKNESEEIKSSMESLLKKQLIQLNNTSDINIRPGI